MNIKLNLFSSKTRAALLVAAMGLIPCLSANAVSYTASSGTGDKHIYLLSNAYDLSTNAWGSSLASSGWWITIQAPSTTTLTNSGWSWSVGTANSGDVKAYPSYRKGASNGNNNSSTSGFPFQWTSSRGIKSTWVYTSTTSGAYNHTWDIFYNSDQTNNQSSRKGEIMIIPKSDQTTTGWGTQSGTYTHTDGSTWRRYTPWQTSGAYGWRVCQYRKNTQTTSLTNLDMKGFMDDARTYNGNAYSYAFGSTSNYVVMIEGGSEAKTGTGTVVSSSYTTSTY